MEVKMPAAEMVDISLLKPYKKNTKKHNQTQIDNVAESIRKFGFVQPFVIEKDNGVVIGHCRVLAAQKLGIKELPCVRVDYLTAAQVKCLVGLPNERNQTNNSLTKTLQAATVFATVPHFMRTSEERRYGRSGKRLSKINSEVKGRESKWLKNGQECLTADRPLTGIRRKKKSGLRRSLRVFAAYNARKKKYAVC